MQQSLFESHSSWTRAARATTASSSQFVTSYSISMRLVDCVNLLLMLAAVVLTCCEAASPITHTDQTRVTKVASLNAELLNEGDFVDQKRYLRNNAVTEDTSKNSENDEERDIIPASVRIALKRLVTKDDAVYTHGTGAGGEKEWWTKVLKFYGSVRGQIEFPLRTAYWEFHFLVWVANKRTPAKMYDKLKVIETTGPSDKNYRIYINYLRFYEYFKGPAYNPIHTYGPKFKTDRR